MDIGTLQQMLADQVEQLTALVAGVSQEQAHWKPAPDRWSILEVVNHLYDEERQDFRVYLDIILNRPGDPWPSIDPMGWITERHYSERELQTSFEALLAERGASLAWLNTLGSPDLDVEVSNEYGTWRAGDMAASWVVHGQWHMEQLIRLLRDYTIRQLQPYRVAYAGRL